MADLGKELEAYCTRKGVALDAVVRKSLLDLSSAIIKRTPVDQGRLRGNMNAAVGTINTATTEATDTSGSQALASISAAVQHAPGSVYYLTNSLPYAQVVEFGEYGTGPYATEKTTRDGFSVQAPYGMFRVSIREYEDYLTKAIAAAK